MSYLALDLSKKNTGWAIWDGQSDRPRSGSWTLGSEFSSDGQVFGKLHRCLSDLYKVMPFERLYFEEPINPAQLQGGTNIQSIRILSGLAAHAQSFAAVKRLRAVKEINISTWRRDFIGDMVVKQVNAGVRAKRKAGGKASGTDQLKRLTIERCRQLGMDPRSNDESDAIGILTYAVLLNGETPPWLANETLRPMMVTS